MSETSSLPPAAAPRGPAALLPIIGVVFTAYLVIGLAMPVLPLHVHEVLGMDTFVVGVVAGSQFAAALLSRLFAGNHADSRGPKRAVAMGLLGATAAGLLYLLSLRCVRQPELSILILLLGRALQGMAESFIITGALSWGLVLLGPQNTGKVMSWVGTALYAAFAAGAPAGTALYARHGFWAIALATVFVPLAALAWVALLGAAAPPPARARASFMQVAGIVWGPGVGLALSGVGFAAITTFIALLFAERGWSPAWLALTALCTAFMAGRLLFGHLPDRLGGARVALVCVLIEAMGQGLIWLANTSAVVLAGVTLTGLGYSLVYPGFGVEAVSRAPPQSRGLAMGAYTAFLDVSLGLSSPVLGLVASRTGLGTVFVVSTGVVLCAAAVALARVRAPAAA
jgi:MFS family permease